MKATCPNDPNHKTFLTTGHVMEEWLVDEEGNFLERRDFLETTHGADPDNIWSCATCKAEAKVKR